MTTDFDLASPDDAVILSVQEGRGDGAIRVQVSGELDFASARRLRDTVEGIQLDGHRRVVLDVTGLTFCDAGGVGALLRAHRTVLSEGGQLVVRGASGLPRRVLAITGVDTLLDLE